MSRLMPCLFVLCAFAAFAHEGEEEEVDAGVPTPRQTTVRAKRPAHSATEVEVPRDVLEATPRSGATDLLRAVPGLVATQHSGEGKAQQLFLRGFDAVHGQDVELNVAGLPVNQVSHIHALGYADLNWLIPEAVREVRVTEGSARAWQGDFAVAGTVRYELGLEEPGVQVGAGYGSFNRFRLFAGFRPRDLGESFAAVEYVQGDGFGPQRAFGRVSALGQLILKLDHVTLRAVGGSYGARFDSPGVMREDQFRSGDKAFFDANGAGQGGAVQRHQLLLGADFNDGEGRTTVELFGVFNENRLRNNFTGFLVDAQGDGLEQYQRSFTFGGRAVHQRHLHVGGEVLSLELGVSGRGDVISQSQRGYVDADGSPRSTTIDAEFTQTMGSAWTELAWAPGGWRFMLGGRADVLHVNLRDTLAFSGLGATRSSLGPHFGIKAGIERELGDYFRAFLSYGDGFRTPQARQLSDGERAPFVNVHGGELGVRFDSRFVSASAAGFMSFVANDFFFDHTVGTTSFVGETLRGGGQAMFTARPVDGFVISGNVTVATAQLLEKNALLPYFAPLVGRLDTGWSRKFDVGPFVVTPRVGLGATVIGPRPLPYNEFSRTVVLVDARAGVRVGMVELTFDVQNLLDSLWRDGEYVFASNFGNQSRLPSRHFTAGSPRTFFLNLEIHL
ncbi:MAG: TonB-dependent receptor [Archangium sp.]